MNIYQEKYTSSIKKLIYNTDRLAEIKKGIFRPISLQFAITDNCNLNCEFCSNKKREGNEFTFEEIKNILNVFKRLGARSVEFTGGEPTLHPQINEIINYAKSLDYSIGIKSNGVDIHKRLTYGSMGKLTWLRISLNSLDYVDPDKLVLSYISDFTDLGFSYVYTDKSNIDILNVLKEFKDKYKAKYVRVIPDNAYSNKKIGNLNNSVGNLDIFKEQGFFWQNKNYELPHQCWMMWLKPFINTDKNIYYCCCSQMFEYKFIDKYRLCSTDTNDILKNWLNPKVHFGKEMCKGIKCYFKPQNDFIAELLKECEHSDFI